MWAASGMPHARQRQLVTSDNQSYWVAMCLLGKVCPSNEYFKIHISRSLRFCWASTSIWYVISYIFTCANVSPCFSFNVHKSRCLTPPQPCDHLLPYRSLSQLEAEFLPRFFQSQRQKRSLGLSTPPHTQTNIKMHKRRFNMCVPSLLFKYILDSYKMCENVRLLRDEKRLISIPGVMEVWNLSLS